jgi:predicted CoA-substrate-specific enzyme activase
MVLGIDIGSCYTKGILVDSRVVGKHLVKTSFKPKSAIEEVMNSLTGYDRIVATGYGRELVAGADRIITEILALARGASYINPAVRTVIDIGGQDSKIIKVKDRKIERFVMNDRCAAGTGNFVEKIGLSLGLTLDEFGRLALQSDRPEPIDSLCVVMAETEILSLVSEEKRLEDIVFGVCNALIRRLIGMGSQIGIEEPVLFCGGGALNPGLVKALKRAIKDVTVPNDPQFVGALGAAVSSA